MRTVILIVLITCAQMPLIQGAAAARPGTPPGGVEVIVDPAIPMLVEKHIQVNQAREGIPGYRIQIFFDSGNNSKTRGQSAYETFQARFPDVHAYLTFKAPNYKVRVGDFRTRLDAVRFLQQILADYPGAYVITDQIRLPNVN